MPPMLGTVPERVDDPLMTEVFGLTPEYLATIRYGRPTAELRGYAASRGVVVGPARVLRSAPGDRPDPVRGDPGLRGHHHRVDARVRHRRRLRDRHRRQPGAHRSGQPGVRHSVRGRHRGGDHDDPHGRYGPGGRRPGRRAGSGVTSVLDLARLAATAERAARAGGAVLTDQRGQPVEITLKDARVDVTSSVDLAAQRAVAAEIRAAHPDHRVVGEERDGRSTPGASRPARLVRRPARRHPQLPQRAVGYFCVSVAVARGRARCWPARSTTRTTTSCSRGRPAAAARSATASRCGWPDVRPARTRPGRRPGPVRRPRGDRRVRRADATADERDRRGALPRRARAGARPRRRRPARPRYCERTMDPWDVAAGRLLVEEAGGRITRLRPAGPAPVDEVVDLVATNGRIHDALLAVLSTRTGTGRNRERRAGQPLPSPPPGAGPGPAGATSLEEAEAAGRFGPADERELFDDYCRLAIARPGALRAGHRHRRRAPPAGLDRGR